MPRPSEHHLNQACGQLVSSKLDENLKRALKLQVASSLDVKCGVVLVSSCPSITKAYFSYLQLVNLDTLNVFPVVLFGANINSRQTPES